MATCRDTDPQPYLDHVRLVDEVVSSVRLSEIPCRVSSDPHERCNDLAAVSRRDPAKLRYP